MLLSIVIPVLNEVEVIEETLRALEKRLSNSTNTEIIIVDGGSHDGTPDLLRELSNELRVPLRLIDSPRGRAVQMNRGAALAQGAVLYFLHADSIPPAGFDHSIREALRNGQVAGCFRLVFDNRHPILRISQWFTRFNWKICRGGDQSLFVKREVFEECDGFNEDYPVYEDCELINRLYDRYTFCVLKDSVRTSARKYRERGTYRLQYHFAVIHLKYWLGSSPEELLDYYQRNISS